jgi:hypothetical protein
MDARFLLALSTCATLLAGCSSESPPFTMTAFEAIALGMPTEEGVSLVGVYGVEGPQPRRSTDFLAFHGDGDNDGVLGDGQVSQWVLGIDGPRGYEEILVGTEGVLDRKAVPDRPEFLYDQRVWIDVWRRLDSHEAAEIAAADPDFAQRTGANGGYTYGYSPYRQDDPASENGGRWAGLPGRSLDMVGRTNGVGQWTVTYLDPEWPDGQPPRAHEATIGFDGVVQQVTDYLPLRMRPAYDELVFEESLAAEGREPGVHSATFEVGDGAVVLRGAMYPRAILSIPGTERHDAAYVRLIRPAGDVAYEGRGQYGLDKFSTTNVPPGTWTLEIWHELDVPATVYLRGFLDIVEPIQRGESH